MDDDPLPSWSDSPARAAVLDFVAAVTDPAGPDFLPPEERRAVFDHDGTLWCEKPALIHFFAILDRYKELLRDRPLRLSGRLARALFHSHADTESAGDHHALVDRLGDVLGVPFAGMTDEAFGDWVTGWLDRWRHPRFGVGYRRLVYRPMVELMNYLRAGDFRITIASADEAAFVRLVAPLLYDIRPAQVLGSSFLSADPDGEGPLPARRGFHLTFFDDGAAKQSCVAREAGRPALVVGNSDGDLPLMEWAAGAPGRTLSLVLRHTDGAREYAYDGRAEAVLARAAERGWPVIDMAADWKTVFPS